MSDGTELSTEDLKAFLASGIPNDSKSTLTINNQMASLTKKAAAMQPAGPLMEEDFDPENVTQGRAGSCVMLSTEAGTSSETIRSMFSDNHDGTYTVASRTASPKPWPNRPCAKGCITHPLPTEGVGQL